MNEELIKRIELALRLSDSEIVSDVLSDCRAALSQREPVRYVPMTDEMVDEILSEIDDIAREVCMYEYGLPMYDCAELQLMREVIRRVARGSKLEVQE